MINTNLMSYLNSNTKLLAVEQTIDKLDLNFNEYIFNNYDEKDILEEVIYTIGLSVRENYDVKEVNILVEDEENLNSLIKTRLLLIFTYNIGMIKLARMN